MSPEHEDFHEDEDQEEYGARSIFAAGWFRAVLVLTVLAIVVVVALPYLLNWFEPMPPPVKAPSRQAHNADSSPTPSLSAPPASQTAAAPSMPTELPSAPAKSAVEKPRASAPATAVSQRPAVPAPMSPTLPPQTVKAVEAPPRVERVALTSTKSDDTRRSMAGNYWLQLGIFKERQNAEALARKAREQGFPIQVARVTRAEPSPSGGLPAGTYHLVRAGGFPDQSAATGARQRLSDKGYSSFVTEGAAK
ncbi:MAG TPA: SPOR domain-containing protein [Methylomirabilota bacterium]|jgi:cell division septation protein DedD|nr:SPOR domain-containing protein [Methylomirabilota bacterium]